jgi:hypothetical protein
MSQLRLFPVDHPDVAPLPISARLKSQLVYFMTPPTTEGVGPLAEDEYWFNGKEVAIWLSEGVFHLVSPLDSANTTEVELTEEQEAFLDWLSRHQIERVRVVE